MPNRLTPYYPSVEKAKFEQDNLELSRLGRKGGQSKKKRKIGKWLFGSWQMRQEANEHICPLKD